MCKEKPDVFWAWCGMGLGTLILLLAISLTRGVLIEGVLVGEKVILPVLLYVLGGLFVKMSRNLVAAHLRWLYGTYILSSTGRTLMFLEIKDWSKKVGWTIVLLFVGCNGYRVFFDWTQSVDIAMFASSPAFLSILLVWLRR